VYAFAAPFQSKLGVGSNLDSLEEFQALVEQLKAEEESVV
jgi:hypothetical protein